MDTHRLRTLPKVELHNHLDGGLRVVTVLELADEVGYDRLPAEDEASLAAWFYRGGSGSLEQYLAGFEHTVAVMQTQSAIRRVAYEAGLDLHADGVIYAEIRFAPVLNTRRGLSREDVIESALDGFAAATAETGVALNLIVDAMRNFSDSEHDARAAVRFANSGVVGFDLAGPEAGFPPEAHEAACRIARDGGLHITIHAGEAAGPQSVAAALDICGAERIGHGISLVEQIDPKTHAMGPIAAAVASNQVPLEICPTSNLHTLGITAAQHPLGLLARSGFNISLNTDNRLMSAVTLTDEFEFAISHHGMDDSDLMRMTLSAAEASFADDSTCRALQASIRDAYAS